MLNVIAKSVAKKEKIEETKQAMIALLAPTRKEKGCILYELHQDQKAPENFFFYETWESVEDLEKHLANDHLQKWAEQQKTLLDVPMEVFFLDKIEL